MDVNITSAIIGALVAGIAAPLGTAVWQKLSGKQYMTKAACKTHHEAIEKACDSCKANTKQSICSIQHAQTAHQEENKKEMQKIRRLLVTIAMHNPEIPKDKLEEFIA